MIPDEKPRAGKPPARQHYAADFLADERVALMTTTQVGAYALLLDFHWREGSIPADRKRIAKLSRLNGKRFEAVWDGSTMPLRECFQPHPEEPGRLIQKRVMADLKRFTKKGSQYPKMDNSDAAKALPLLTPSESVDVALAAFGPPGAPSSIASASASFLDTSNSRATVGSPNGVKEVEEEKGSSADLRPPRVDLGPPGRLGSRSRPKPLSPEQSRLAGSLIAAIERFEEQHIPVGPKRFDPGEWWGKGVGLRYSPDAMLDTLRLLVGHLREGTRPTEPWAYCSKTYAEKAANRAADAAEADSVARREPLRREAKGLK